MHLHERLESLTRRLADKQGEKSRYVKLYAQGHVDEEELEIYLADLKNQVENLKLLIVSVETDLTTNHENKMVVARTEVWHMTLRETLAGVEQVTEEAFGKRRELAKLLVQQITTDRNEEGKVKVVVTYRFGPPEVSLGVDSAGGVQNTEGVLNFTSTEQRRRPTARTYQDVLLRGRRRTGCRAVQRRRLGIRPSLMPTREPAGEPRRLRGRARIRPCRVLRT